ncbi:MAG: hypothetical protein IPK86_01960 [Neisseriales bacterium]|nr:MAG: hypothetical protein IPK86_01960 [Neisseriales bacterium]
MLRIIYRAQHKRSAIKVLLLDQSFIAGIGNIYASEILFRAGIHPAKVANTLSYLQWRLLLNSIRFILKQAVQSKGSTIRDFLSVEGQLGNFQHQHKVYGRTNQPCVRCKKPIQSLIQQGRSSFYCPHCQLLKMK